VRSMWESYNIYNKDNIDYYKINII
jgi:hypothetical protein